MSSLNINYVFSFHFFLSDTLENQTPSLSACGITRRFTRSKGLGSWAVSAFCPTPSTALKTQAVSVSVAQLYQSACSHCHFYSVIIIKSLLVDFTTLVEVHITIFLPIHSLNELLREKKKLQCPQT